MRATLGSVNLSAVLVCVCGLSVPTGAAVVFHQVEAGTAQYAPIDFNGSATRTIPGSATGTDEFYIGKTFHALSGTASSTYFFHADQFVGRATYRGPTLADPGGTTVAWQYVNDIYNQTVNDFVGVVNPFTAINTSAPAPGTFGNGIRVSNHSWAGTFAPGNPNADEDFLRRVDYMTNREDVVFVGGAVTQVGSNNGLNLAWAAHNEIAVRGTLNIFTPATAPNPAGRRHGDLWETAEASRATAKVSGYAAALIGRAQTLGFADAQRMQVVKSLLMTAADKTQFDNVSSPGVAPWTRDTANHLDTDAGAGKADYLKSKSILEAGQRTVHNITGGVTITGATPSTNSQGWAFATAPTANNVAVVIQTTGAIDTLTATLNWNVTPREISPGTIDTVNQDFANLDLELRPLTNLGGGNFAVGGALGDATLISAATGDNLEHLYFTGLLPAGYYAFYIKSDVTLAAPFGFSYDIVTTSEIPEPAAGAVILLGAGAACLRRRRRAS